MKAKIESMKHWQDIKLPIEKTTRVKTLTIKADATITWTANRNSSPRYDARGWIGHQAGVDYKMPSKNEGCLVCMLQGSEGDYLFAFDKAKLNGNTLTLTIQIPASMSGRLCMAINDNAGIGDNDGIIPVEAEYK